MTIFYLICADQQTWEAAKPQLSDTWIDEIGTIDTDTRYHVNLKTWNDDADAKVAAIVDGTAIQSVVPNSPSRVWA